MAYKVFGPISDAGYRSRCYCPECWCRSNQRHYVHRTEERILLEAATRILETTAKEMAARGIQVDDKVAKLSLVGVGMRSHAGIASRMFETLV